MLSHRVQWAHGPPCTCGGYHYPHRPGSPCCEANPLAHYARALRDGADPLDVAADMAWELPGAPLTAWPYD